jgi:hypothetical protein
MLPGDRVNFRSGVLPKLRPKAFVAVESLDPLRQRYWVARSNEERVLTISK